MIEPHAVDVQDRDGGGALLQASRKLYPFIRLVWADGGCNHERVTPATQVRVEIISKIAGQSSVVVLPRRWVAEQSAAAGTSTAPRLSDSTRNSYQVSEIVTRGELFKADTV